MASQGDEGRLLLAPVDLVEPESYAGSARIEIVGVQYYTGIISNKEGCTFRREPHNPYDAMAIGVHAAHDPDRNKLGHVSRQNAAVLAPLMDTRGLRLEGVVPFGATNAYKIPMDIHLFCPRASLAAVQHGIQRLPVGASLKYINYDINAVQVVDMTAVVKGGQAAGAAAAAAAARAPAAQSAAAGYRVTAAALPSESDVLSHHLDSLFVEPVPYDAQPQAAQPATVVTPMYPHQLKAVAWMAEREAAMTVKTALAHQRQLAAQAAAAAAAAAPSACTPSGKGAGKSASSATKAAASSSSSGSSGTAENAALAHIAQRVRAAAASRCFFWQEILERGEVLYQNVATGQCVRDPPLLPRGGILADEMGLGKTLTAIALIAAGKEAAGAGEAASSSSSPAAAAATFAPASGPTLIVCPVSVLSVWREQLATHVAPGALSVYTHYGSQRTSEPSVLAQYDVVITSYSVLAAETSQSLLEAAATGSGGGESDSLASPGRGKGQSPLQRLQWARVILDEAHSVRNKSTRQARAAYALLASARWAVTGTPIQNSLSDLQSLLRYLRVSPFSDHAWFNSLIARPVRAAEPVGFERVSGLIASVCLRRTKSMRVGADGRPLLLLPPRRVHTLRIALSPADRKRYDTLADVTRAEFRRLMQLSAAAGGGAGAGAGGSGRGEAALLESSASVLEVLLRLRQLACHSALVPDAVLARAEALARSLSSAAEAAAASSSSSSAAAAAASSLLSASREVIAKLLAALEITAEDDCAICLSTPDPTERVMTACAHSFHRECLLTALASQKRDTGLSTCPLCRRAVAGGDVIGEEDLRAKAAEVGVAAGAGAAPAPAGAAAASSSSASAALPPPSALSSSKVDALVRALKALIAGGGPAEAQAAALGGAGAPAHAAASDGAAAAPTAAPAAGSSKPAPAVVELTGAEQAAADAAIAAARGGGRGRGRGGRGGKARGGAASAAPAAGDGDGGVEAPSGAAEGDASGARRSSRAGRRTARYVDPGSDDEEGADGAAAAGGDDEDDDDDGAGYGRKRGGKKAAAAAAPAKKAKRAAAVAASTGDDGDEDYVLEQPVARSGGAAAAASSSSSAAASASATQQQQQQPLSGLRTKSVAFSQWTTLLDVIAARLAAEGVRFVRLDGAMSAPAREAAVAAFQTDPGVHVFLVSIKAGGTGLTLTAASNVFIVDPTFNPAAEDQAMDRIHRLGQVSAVDVYVLVAADTIEENVVKLQERKRALASGAFGGVKTRDDIRRMRLDELRLLMA